VRIRPAVAADGIQIAEFTRATFSWGDYVAGAFTGWLAEPDSALAVAEREDSGDVVGVVHTVITAPGEAWMEGLRVHPEYRRQGIADALNLDGRAWTAARGAMIARLGIDAVNVAAQQQVEHLGFQPCATFMYAETAAHPRTPDAADDRDSGATRSRVARATGVRLAQANDAGWLAGAWRASGLRSAAGGLWARGWRWWSAGLGDVAAARRRNHVLCRHDAFVVCDLTGEPAEIRWFEFPPDTDGGGSTRDSPTHPTGAVPAFRQGPGTGMKAAETVGALAAAAVDAAYATGHATVRAMVPAVDALKLGLESAGFDVRSELIVYQAPTRTTW
jgi:ribosomal protein S18 acetylase RimI-like enzyme